MQTNNLMALTIVLLCVPPAFAVEGYGTTTSWIEGIQGCNQNFDVAVSGHNITDPNTFSYTLTYSVVYCNADDVVITTELEVESFSRSLPVGLETQETFSHFIPTFSLNNLIQEIESGDESPTNKTRYVKIVYASTLTDDGGTHDDNEIGYVWFTSCYPEGTYTPSYEGQYVEVGFDINSIGGEGGSGLLAGEVGWGAQDETSIELGKVFGIIFYGFIPFLFIMLWIKMSNKVMK